MRITRKEIETKLAQLISTQDRDEQNALEWLNVHTEDKHIQIWMEIQALCDKDDAVSGIIGRFAQYGFTQLEIIRLTKLLKDS